MLATPSPDMFRIQQLQVRAAPMPHPTGWGPQDHPVYHPASLLLPWGSGRSELQVGRGLEDLHPPLQIFNLMKFDSYARFVKSPLYQACLRAESQGQPLPDLRPHSRSSSPPPDLSKVNRVGTRGRGLSLHLKKWCWVLSLLLGANPAPG